MACWSLHCGQHPAPERRHRAAAAQAASELHWYKATRTRTRSTATATARRTKSCSWYREHGYQFLVLTDHNYLTSVDGLNAVHGAPDKFLVIRGEEVTSRSDSKPVHVNGLDVRELVAPPRRARCSTCCSEASMASAAARHSAHQPSQFRLGDDRRRPPPARTHPSVRDLQRPSRRSTISAAAARRVSKRCGTVPVERPPDVRPRRGRCALFQAAGGRQRAGPGRGWIFVRAARLRHARSSTRSNAASSMRPPVWSCWTYLAAIATSSSTSRPDVEQVPRAVHRPRGRMLEEQTICPRATRSVETKAMCARGSSNRTAGRRGRSRCRSALSEAIIARSIGPPSARVGAWLFAGSSLPSAGGLHAAEPTLANDEHRATVLMRNGDASPASSRTSRTAPSSFARVSTTGGSWPWAMCTDRLRGRRDRPA